MKTFAIPASFEIDVTGYGRITVPHLFSIPGILIMPGTESLAVVRFLNGKLLASIEKENSIMEIDQVPYFISAKGFTEIKTPLDFPLTLKAPDGRDRVYFSNKVFHPLICMEPPEIPKVVHKNVPAPPNPASFNEGAVKLRKKPIAILPKVTGAMPSLIKMISSVSKKEKVIKSPKKAASLKRENYKSSKEAVIPTSTIDLPQKPIKEHIDFVAVDDISDQISTPLVNLNPANGGVCLSKEVDDPLSLNDTKPDLTNILKREGGFDSDTLYSMVIEKFDEFLETQPTEIKMFLKVKGTFDRPSDCSTFLNSYVGWINNLNNGCIPKNMFKKFANILIAQFPREFGEVRNTRKRKRDGGRNNTKLYVRLKNFYNLRFGSLKNDKQVSTSEGSDSDEEVSHKKSRRDHLYGLNPYRTDVTSLELKERCSAFKKLTEATFESDLGTIFCESERFIQYELWMRSPSSLKSACPFFFSDIKYFHRHFNNISFGTDIFANVQNNLKKQMILLEKFLMRSLRPSRVQKIIDELEETRSSNIHHSHYLLLKALAEIWNQDIDQVIHHTDKSNKCEMENPAPHIVIIKRDYSNVYLYVYGNRLYDGLSFCDAIAAMIGFHFACRICYDSNCHLLKEYIQKNIAVLSPSLGNKLSNDKSCKTSRKLNTFRKILEQL